MPSLFTPYPTRRKGLVCLKDSAGGHSLRGVLWQMGRRYLILRNAEMVRPGQEPVPMDGEVVVPRENVLFIQVVT